MSPLLLLGYKRYKQKNPRNKGECAAGLHSGLQLDEHPATLRAAVATNRPLYSEEHVLAAPADADAAGRRWR